MFEELMPLKRTCLFRECRWGTVMFWQDTGDSGNVPQEFCVPLHKIRRNFNNTHSLLCRNSFKEIIHLFRQCLKMSAYKTRTRNWTTWVVTWRQSCLRVRIMWLRSDPCIFKPRDGIHTSGSSHSSAESIGPKSISTFLWKFRKRFIKKWDAGHLIFIWGKGKGVPVLN
jgi:hypothetical protein